MEVGGKEKRGAGAQGRQAGQIPTAKANGSLVMAYKEPEEVEAQLEIPSSQEHLSLKSTMNGEGGLEGVKVEAKDAKLPPGNPEQCSQQARNRVKKAGKQESARQLHFIQIFGIFDKDYSDFGANP